MNTNQIELKPTQVLIAQKVGQRQVVIELDKPYEEYSFGELVLLFDDAGVNYNIESNVLIGLPSLVTYELADAKLQDQKFGVYIRKSGGGGTDYRYDTLFPTIRKFINDHGEPAKVHFYRYANQSNDTLEGLIESFKEKIEETYPEKEERGTDDWSISYTLSETEFDGMDGLNDNQFLIALIERIPRLKEVLTSKGLKLDPEFTEEELELIEYICNEHPFIRCTS